MAKNKTKITKEDLRTPDAFLTFADKVGKSLSDNWKPIAVALGLILITAIGYTTMTAMNRAKEATASEALFEIEKKIDDIRMEHSKKQQDAVKDLMDKAEENEKEIESRLKNVPEIDYEKDFASIAAELEQVIEQYSDTQSAQMSRIRLAKLYIDYEKLDQAENVLRSATQQAQPGTSIYGLSRTLLASVLSYKGNTQESIQWLSEVLVDQKLSYLHSEVLLKLGILNKEVGDTAKAEEMFRRVTTEFGDTEAGKTAKNYLKMIRFLTPKTDGESKASTVDL